MKMLMTFLLLSQAFALSPRRWAKSVFNLTPASYAQRKLMHCARRLAKNKFGGKEGVTFIAQLLEETRNTKDYTKAMESCQSYVSEKLNTKLSEKSIYQGLEASQTTKRTKKFVAGLYRPYNNCSYVGSGLNTFYINILKTGIPSLNAKALIGHCISTHGKLWLDVIFGGEIKSYYPGGLSLGESRFLLGRTLSPYSKVLTKVFKTKSLTTQGAIYMLSKHKRKGRVDDFLYVLDPTHIELISTDESISTREFHNFNFKTRLKLFKKGALDVFNLYNWKKTGFAGLGVGPSIGIEGHGEGRAFRGSTFSLGYYASVLANVYFGSDQKLQWPLQL